MRTAVAVHCIQKAEVQIRVCEQFVTRSFGAVTTFEGRGAVVSLRGRVDDVAAFELAAVLDAVVSRQPASMVLELADLIFIGPAGLLVIANTEGRLAASGVALTIRSPSFLVNHLLGIVEETRATPGSGHLGPEQLDGAAVVSQRFGSSLSTRDLRRVAGMPTDPDVVDGALSLVVELALTSIGDADGVSVSLLRHGVLSTVAASDQTIMAMDADQYATSEGPCVDASVKGHWFMPSHSTPRPAGPRSPPGPAPWGSRRSCPRRCGLSTNPSARSTSTRAARRPSRSRTSRRQPPSPRRPRSFCATPTSM